MMEVRPYAAEDLEVVFALWRAVTRATYTFFRNPTAHTEAEDRAFFTGVIAVENDLWVAQGDAGILGFMAVRGDLLDRLYVAVEQQGRGVGSALLQRAKALSPTGLRLFTHQGNVGACRFYERRGFTAVRRGLSPPPESEPDVEYRWAPPAP